MLKLAAVVMCLGLAAAVPAVAQVQNYKPVTNDMLLNPKPGRLADVQPHL
jgi:hypothetical protein